MDADIQAALQSSPLTIEQKTAAIRQALEIASPIALEATEGNAGGFIEILLELFKILLPILLEMLKPRS